VPFTEIIRKGIPAFSETYVQPAVHYDADLLGSSAVRADEQLQLAASSAAINQGLRHRLPAVQGRGERRDLSPVISDCARYELRERMRDQPALLGKTETVWLLADDDVDVYIKSSVENRATTSRLNEQQQDWVDTLSAAGDLDMRFNASLF